jgi:tetratricopeptide (TPR) repeat protein
MKKIILAIMSALVLMFVVISFAQTQSPQQTLNEYVSDLQKNPSDYALREKIIKHVQTMKPAPAIPEEARRCFIEGNALLKAAKAQKGYELAIDAYRQCLLIAPWWAEAYFNYAVALDLANRFDEAVNVLKLYIATNPGGEESRKAQDKIYEIGAKKKLAAQEREESSPQAVAAREQNKFEDWLKKLDGRRFDHDKCDDIQRLQSPHRV